MGLGGGGAKTAAVPASAAQNEAARQAKRAEIANNPSVDTQSRQELLDYIDAHPDNPGDLQAKYAAALDPNNATTKDRQKTDAIKKIAADQPGLRQQTSFLGAPNPAPATPAKAGTVRTQPSTISFLAGR